MFTKTAKSYDLIYSFKDYAAEAESIRAVIHREHLGAFRSRCRFGSGGACQAVVDNVQS